MRLICPACQAVYEVSPILLAGRGAVRCARCGHQWTPEGGVEAEDRASGPLLTQEPYFSAPGFAPDSDPPPLMASRPRVGLWAAWILTFLVIAVAAWVAVSYRGDVMHAWPPSTRGYAALGFSTSAPAAAPAPAQTK